MNIPPDSLEPLFRWSRAARQAPGPASPPPGFATRVLAELRPPPERDWLLWLLPRVVTFAALLAVLGWIPPFGTAPETAESELAGAIFEHSLPSQP